MRVMNKKTCLSDSFESQKIAARAVANGLLDKEVRATGVTSIKQSEIDKAKARRNRFAKKYGF